MKSTAFFNSQWMIGAIITAAIICAVTAVVFMDRTGQKGNGLSQEFQYDLASLRKTDPALILYEEAGPRINTGLSWARAIAVGPEDRIYVIGGSSMHTFSSTGQRLPLNIELDQEMTAITVVEDGTIYLGVGDHIEIYDSSGQLMNRWESIGSKAEITSIAVAPDQVFAADFGSRSMLRYDQAGNRKDSFGDFVLPSNYFDVAICTDGFLQVANNGRHRVETYTFDGNLMSWWGEFSNQNPHAFCGCCNPVNFALLPNREGYVTCEKGLSRVKVYDRDGVFVGFVAGAEQFEQQGSLTATPDYCYNRMGLDVAVDSKSQVLVLDPAFAEVRIYKRKNIMMSP